MLGRLSQVNDCNCHRCVTVSKESLQRSNVCTHFMFINSIHITQQHQQTDCFKIYNLSWWQPAARGHRAYTDPSAAGVRGRYYAQAAALTTGK